MRLKAALLCTVFFFPATAASADPFSAFFLGLTQAGAVNAAVAGAIGGLTSFAYTAGAFFATGLGSILLNIGLAALTQSQSRSPSVDAARVNTRFESAMRWQAAGRCVLGGEVGTFIEHDNAGNLWFIVAHADAELIGEPTYIFDGIEVELDGSGFVITDEFCLNTKGDQYEGTGTRLPIWRIYTVTPDAGALFGALPAAFTSAFPNLPVDFRLAGVAFSIIRGRSISPKNYSKAYRWRGAIGVGEPAVSVVANWNRMYDPRNPAHDIGDNATWTAGDGNPEIIWAWFRTSARGKNRPMSEINWPEVAARADICDQSVLDRDGNPKPRYRCGLAWPDNKPRHECEAEILATCDGYVAYNNTGRAYLEVGHYVAPTLTFSAARDILTAETEIIDDGEAAVDGVVVNYISPMHGYTKQPSAPWVNSFYYDGVSEPNYIQVDILGIQNHNQAVRIAKALGLRAAAEKRVGLGVTIKGLLARGVRTFNLDYDDIFQGPFEIVTPVQGDPSGIGFSFAAVPMQVDRYNLLPGEEGQPPELPIPLNIDNALEDAASVNINAVKVTVSGGAAVRLEADFAAPVRVDRAFRFRYAPTTTTVYEYFTTDMDTLTAYSSVVNDGAVYDVSWQTVTASGRASDFTAPIQITARANTVAPQALIAFAASNGVGQSVVTFTTANSANQYQVEIRRGTTAVFGASAVVQNVIAGANVSNSITNAGLAPGTYYYWAVPRNGSDVSGPISGPDTATIT